jgi:hypothetical protein
MTPFQVLLYVAILPAICVAVVMPIGFMLIKKVRKKSPKFREVTDIFNLWLEKKSPSIKESLTMLCVIAFFAYVIFVR